MIIKPLLYNFWTAQWLACGTSLLATEHDIYSSVMQIPYVLQLSCVEALCLSTILVNTGGRIVCYSYIPLGVGYHCYYTSPRRSQGRVLITMISYEYSGI